MIKLLAALQHNSLNGRLGCGRMKIVTWQPIGGFFWTCWMSALVSMVAEVNSTRQHLCNRAQNRCVSRVGCGMALHNYYINCGALINGEINECTPKCQKALISLLSTEDQEGANFMECDCDGNSFCLNQKERMAVCTHDVMAAMKSVSDDHTDISCSLAELICRADTSCLTALDYYERFCTKLFRGEKCTAKCNNSLAILYRQTKARKLRTCICDGSEDYPCEAIQENTDKLCFDLIHSRHRHRHRHRNQTEGSSGDAKGDIRNPESDNAIARQQKNKDRIAASSHSHSHSIYNSRLTLCIVVSLNVLILLFLDNLHCNGFKYFLLL